MLDMRNRPEPYRRLAQECRRLATNTSSSQIKTRYLLMAQDYMWLADLKEQAHGTPATVEENAAWAAAMTGRFPAPWRIVEIPHGFAVDDATGQQLAVFYGLAEPNTPRQTDFLTFDEARQMAVDFAKLPQQHEQSLGRSEVTTSPKDDRLTKLETNRSPEGALDAWHLPRVARLPSVAGLPSAEMPAAVPKSSSFKPDEWMSTPLLPRRSDPLATRTKFLIAIAIAVLPAGYFVVKNSDRPADDVAVRPQATTDKLPVEFLPSREAQAPAAAATGTTVESRVEPEVQAPSLQQTAPLETKPTESATVAKPPSALPERGSFAARTAPLDTKPTESATVAKPPSTLPERGSAARTAPLDTKPTESATVAKPPSALPERGSFAAREASTCLPSASAVRENHPGAWPSWTLRAPGHEGTRCWYATSRGTAHDHR
jgi:hypothetical protein